MRVLAQCDSNAAIGTAHRAGNGRLRHVRISDLWIQERVKEGNVSISNILGTDNIADMLTKDITAKVRDHLMKLSPQSLEIRPSEKQLHIGMLEVIHGPRPQHHGPRQSATSTSQARLPKKKPAMSYYGKGNAKRWRQRNCNWQNGEGEGNWQVHHDRNDEAELLWARNSSGWSAQWNEDHR